MTQKFYQKASVQVAIVSAIGLFAVTAITIWHQRSQLKTDNQNLQREVTGKTSEIQRLETLLTPFRTIALEKFTGDEKQALRKLADDILHLHSQDQVKAKQIASLQTELSKAKTLAAPAELVLAAHKSEQTELGPKIILQFKPTKNERLGRIEFDVSLSPDSTATIKRIKSLYNPCIGESAKVAHDGKSAQDAFTLLGTGLPTFELVVSGPTGIRVKGNYLQTELTFEVK